MLWSLLVFLAIPAHTKIALGKVLSSEFFNYLSMVFLIALILLYLFVAGGSLHGILTGRLFTTPCLSSLLSANPPVSELKVGDHCEEENQQHHAEVVVMEIVPCSETDTLTSIPLSSPKHTSGVRSGEAPLRKLRHEETSDCTVRIAPAHRFTFTQYSSQKQIHESQSTAMPDSTKPTLTSQPLGTSR